MSGYSSTARANKPANEAVLTMKTIGLLGGMSWESTLNYYRLLNEGIKQRLGDLHSAEICLFSVDFDAIEKLQHQGAWDELAQQLSAAACAVERGGADFLLICTNTMHKVAPQVAAAVTIPLVHIADVTGAALQKNAVRRVGLLGTRFTMEEAFFKQRITDNFHIEVLIPNAVQRELIHRVIYQELCLGVIREQSRLDFLAIIAELTAAGADAIILGCTEISMLVQQRDTASPLYDTTAIHVQAAIDLALADSGLAATALNR